ncbi:MAG: hypothetical protein RR515_02275 [Clostridium sp.]
MFVDIITCFLKVFLNPLNLSLSRSPSSPSSSVLISASKVSGENLSTISFIASSELVDDFIAITPTIPRNTKLTAKDMVLLARK